MGSDRRTKLLGSDLRDARKRRGISQREAGRRAGLSAEGYSNIERGTGYPNLTTLIRIAGALDVRFIINAKDIIVELDD